MTLNASASDTNKARFGPILEKTYRDSKLRSESETNGVEARWKFARACFDWADFSDSNSKREEIANEGIAASRKVVEISPSSVEGHYYLAMNLGELAQTKSLGALRIVPHMESEFKIALKLNPDFDFSGPDRNLGLLYLQAPGWPASVGSKSKSRLHLQQALKRAPEYPENLLNMIEAELEWSEKASAAKHLDDLEKLWLKAKITLGASEWEINWVDWESRKAVFKSKLVQPLKRVDSPRSAAEK